MQNIYIKKKYSIDLKKIDNSYQIKQKWDGLAQHIAYIIHKNTDVVLLTLFTDIKEVSVYSVYMLVINGVKNLLLSFNNGVNDTFGNMLAKGDYKELKRSFKKYYIMFTIISICAFIITAILIIPFIKLYMHGIEDTNYIRPTFAYIMIAAELICVIRQPFANLVKVAGHFKQTQIGAWIEAISNIIISFELVWKLGIIGVAIGTLIAILIRMIDLVTHVLKYILKQPQIDNYVN